MMLQMADKFEQPDHLTYVWTLKPGIKFHNVDPVNGRVVTADDVVYSMTRRRDDPVSQNDKQFLRDFTAGFEAVDSQTYKLTTKQPYRPAIDELGNPSYPIVPHEAVEKFGEPRGQSCRLRPLHPDRVQQGGKGAVAQEPGLLHARAALPGQHRMGNHPRRLDPACRPSRRASTTTPRSRWTS